MTASEIAALLDKAKSVGPDKWIARCPAHEDRLPSLSLRQAEDRVLVFCHAGCSVQEIGSALGLPSSAWFSDQEFGEAAKQHAQAVRNHREAQRLLNHDELMRVIKELRRRDMAQLAIRDELDDGKISQDEALDRLAPLLYGYSELEHRFGELNK